MSVCDTELAFENAIEYEEDQSEAGGNQDMVLRTFLIFALSGTAVFGQIERCSVGSPSGVTASLADAWRRIQKALEFDRPREIQRLVSIRLKILDLASAKKKLIGNVSTIVDVGSTPGWLQTRVEAIPQMQDQIMDLMEDIRQEALQGGALAGGDTLRLATEVLNNKRGLTLCELSKIPFPMPSDQFARVKTLLGQLQEEAKSLDEVDRTLGELIRRSQGGH